jgi:hypothetical protein
MDLAFIPVWLETLFGYVPFHWLAPGLAVFFMYAWMQFIRWRRAVKWQPPQKIHVEPFDAKLDEHADFGYGEKKRAWSQGGRKKAATLDMPMDDVETLEPVHVHVGPPFPGILNRALVILAVILFAGCVGAAVLVYGRVPQ